MLCEVECCIECGSRNILYDELSGEAVCRSCGLVLGITEFTAPADQGSKNVSCSPIVYTSAAVGTKMESYQRFELNVAFAIERVVRQLNLPKPVEPIAITYVRRLRRAMRHQKDLKIRFTRTELTALSIWTALKQLKYPLNCNEFSQKILPFLGEVNLVKTEKRALYFIESVPRISDIALVTAHINKIVKTLANNAVINNHYSHILGKYAY